MVELSTSESELVDELEQSFLLSESAPFDVDACFVFLSTQNSPPLLEGRYLCPERAEIERDMSRLSSYLLPREKKVENAVNACFDSGLFNQIQASNVSDMVKRYIMEKFLVSLSSNSKIMECIDSAILQTGSIIESIVYAYHLFSRVTDFTSAYFAFCITWRLLTGESFFATAFDFGKFLGQKCRALFDGDSQPVSVFKRIFHMQSDSVDGPVVDDDIDMDADLESSSYGWILIGARKLLNGYKDIQTCTAVKKFHTLTCYLFSFGLFTKFGIAEKFLDLKQLSKQCAKKSYTSSLDFIYTVLETVVWVLERGTQAIKLGSFEPFLHTSRSYSNWIAKVYQLREDAQKMHNPEATGLDVHKFMHDLRSVIEKGENMLKWATSADEKKTMGFLLSEMRILNANIATKDAAQQQRKAPFSILVSGDSSVGKSMFKQILIRHFAVIRDKVYDSKFIYTRCSADKYWSGFATYKWCIVLDDIAMQATALNTLDPSMADMLQVVNSVPFTPPMADIADKGTCPVNPDLVVATTNTIHLNADSYYSCPLAVRRRFPYVVSIVPREKFRRKVPITVDGVVVSQLDTPMLDETKVPEPTGDRYMDVWNIHIDRVVAQPQPEGKGAAPVLDPVADFEDMPSFLKWYTCMIREFNQVQDKCMKTDSMMEQVKICKRCGTSQVDCTCTEVQAGVLTETELQAWRHSIEESFLRAAVVGDPIIERTPLRYPDSDYSESEESFFTTDSVESDWLIPTWQQVVAECFDDTYLRVKVTAQMLAMGTVVTAKQVGDSILQKASDIMVYYQVKKMKAFFESWGDRLMEKFADWKVKAVCLVLIGAWPVYKGFQMVSKFMTPTKKADTVQALSEGVVPSFMKKDEKPNPWIVSDYQLSTSDIGGTTQGWFKFSIDDVCDRVSKNVLNIQAEYTDETGLHHIPANALCLAGHIYVTDNHCLPDSDCEILLTAQPVASQLTENFRIKVHKEEILRVPERDLAFFLSPHAPRANLSGLLLKKDATGLVGKGSYVHRLVDGRMRLNPVDACKRMPVSVPPLGITVESWMSYVFEPTQMGQCGMPLVVQTPRGPIIAGLHQTGCGTQATSIAIYESDYLLAEKFFGAQVQSGVPPIVGGTKELHPSSVLRWELQGVARVHGSACTGMRACPKSRVTETFISESAQKKGFVKRTFPPVMAGKEPWHVGYKDITNQDHSLIDRTILDHCVEAFSKDIIDGLTEKDLSEMVVLDTKTAINGYPGIRFLDKMNRRTSMGYPYRKPKNDFLVHLEADDVYDDPVDFTPEVQEEIVRILSCYENKTRAMPVFVASLKDEPVPLKKILSKKTRVFMGAPAAWSVVVRKYLLSFVRLFQKNPFLFEGAPGTNCGSTRWGEFYEYLCEFGPDRIIAGDYGKFDKHMSPMILEAAFKVIVNIAKAAKWEFDDLMVILCIAKDVSYPLCDYNGDFVEFLGSNPSGQALTVIINCLANCIYQRYAYCVLSPIDNTCWDFKKRVHTMTYGDDNIMGVSETAPWFTHTALMKELEKIGVEYTMADKESESRAYINISETAFLKRSWRWDADIGAWMCPLEWASIEKMLTMAVKSRAVCVEEQAMCSIESAMSEFFRYGRDTFERNLKLMQEIVLECKLENYVKQSTFVPYETHVARFWAASSHEDIDTFSDENQNIVDDAFDLQCGSSATLTASR
jgi:hypothetical protein